MPERHQSFPVILSLRLSLVELFLRTSAYLSGRWPGQGGQGLPSNISTLSSTSTSTSSVHTLSVSSVHLLNSRHISFWGCF